jgi:protein-S-isoprenylcysteine O-methyltransferase Ste14
METKYINLILLLSIIIIYSFLQKSNQNISTKELLFVLCVKIFGIVIPILSYYFKPFDKFNLPKLKNADIIISLLLLCIIFLLLSVYFNLGKYYSINLNIKSEHKLITSGIYKIIRHPTYLASMLYLIAQQLYIPNKIGIISSIISYALLLFIRIPKEEKLLMNTFGDVYTKYKNKTYNIIPFIY